MTDGEVANKLLGAWRYVSTRINGSNWDRGANPKGMIYYGPHGEMAVQIAPDVDRTRAGAAMTPQEAFTAVKDYIAYFGTYTVDEAASTVTHHRQDSLQPGDQGRSGTALRIEWRSSGAARPQLDAGSHLGTDQVMDVLMPQLGETVAEGKITKWFKSAGDEVKPGDNLFEIETDKVSMEVPSTTTGVLAEIRVPAGAVAPVGAVVGVIADGAGATASAGPQRKAGRCFHPPIAVPGAMRPPRR